MTQESKAKAVKAAQRKNMKLIVREENCIGCRMCQAACSLTKEGVLRLRPSRLQVRLSGLDRRAGITVCRQCRRCRCVEACTYGAFLYDKPTGGVFIDYQVCQSCLACVDACIFQAVFMDPKGEFPMVCDLCQGSTPCASACGVEAIAVYTKP